MKDQGVESAVPSSKRWFIFPSFVINPLPTLSLLSQILNFLIYEEKLGPIGRTGESENFHVYPFSQATHWFQKCVSSLKLHFPSFIEPTSHTTSCHFSHSPLDLFFSPKTRIFLKNKIPLLDLFFPSNPFPEKLFYKCLYSCYQFCP